MEPEIKSTIEAAPEKTRKSTASSFRSNGYLQFRESLVEEFNNECAYCCSELGLTSMPIISHFYPRSKYPELADLRENLLLSCSICDSNKAANFPLDGEGQPLLLNPRTDNFDEHIRVGKDGVAEGITEKGETTIKVFKLNRPALVDDRKVRQLEKDLLDKYAKIDDKFHAVFVENLGNIRIMNGISDIANDRIKVHLRNMLFANIITSLETYLSDAFINTVRSNSKFMRRFVETFHGFRAEKFEVRELFSYYDSIDEKVTRVMLDVIYHDLPKVKGMYAETLGVVFPDLSVLYKAVIKRHDFVHRNGKTKDGVKHELTKEDVEELAKKVEEFVQNVNEQIIALK